MHCEKKVEIDCRIIWVKLLHGLLGFKKRKFNFIYHQSNFAAFYPQKSLWWSAKEYENFFCWNLKGTVKKVYPFLMQTSFCLRIEQKSSPWSGKFVRRKTKKLNKMRKNCYANLIANYRSFRAAASSDEEGKQWGRRTTKPTENERIRK